MGAESERYIGGEAFALKSRQNASIRPGAATIEGGIVADLEAIMGSVGEEFGAANKVEWVERILGQHRFAVSQIGIVADLNVGIRRLGMRAKFDTCASSGKRVQGRWRRGN